jgi:small conductance mechanosensitive channel
MDFLLVEFGRLYRKFEQMLLRNFRINDDTLFEIVFVAVVAFAASKIMAYIFNRLANKYSHNPKRRKWFVFLKDLISFVFLAIFLLIAASNIPIIANKYLTGIEIVLAAFFLHKILVFYINSKLDELEDNNDKTKLSFLQNTLDLLVFLVASFAVIYSIPQLRSFALTLFASAGLFAAFIGLASQKAFANLVSGIFIVIFKPFRVGDVIEVDGNLGEVKDITLRHTRILNYENRSVIIPNANIDSLVIKNSSFPENKVCRYVEVTISYESNIEKAMQIMETEAMQHPFCIDQRTEEDKRKGLPQVRLRTLRLAEYGVTLRANVWAKNADDAYDMHCDLNKIIKEKFALAGIEIPYPHRTLVIKQGREDLKS